MSFPYDLDLMFGSEKSTADSKGRTSFGSSEGGGGGDDPSGGRKSRSFPITTGLYKVRKTTQENAEFFSDVKNVYKTSLFKIDYDYSLLLDGSYLIIEHGDSRFTGIEIKSVQEQDDEYPTVSLVCSFKEGDPYVKEWDNIGAFIYIDGEYKLEGICLVDDQLLKDPSGIHAIYSSAIKKYTLTKVSFKPETTAHLENLTLVDGASQEMQEWWDTNPELIYAPYPIIDAGSSGMGMDVYYEIESGNAIIMGVDKLYDGCTVMFYDSDYNICLTGKLVCDKPNEIILPMNLPFMPGK